MDASKSSVRTNPKPINVFYVWYTELCRRINCTPAPAVKPAKPKCQTVLDFVADRLRLEEWNPIISALRHDTSLHVIQIKSRIGNCQFLQDIDTEEKARHMKRRFGLLWTAYILKQLTKSLSISLRHTEVLTVLELDGLPMFSDYLEPLLQALKKNKTIKSLSFANCPIKDVGCQLVCAYLRFTPNVEVINLSGCGLTVKSGEQLAKLIKYQQINRYCESWHNSLRYEDPMSGVMRGIKRITINCNPDLGDNGFNYILDELEDDLWIKALDVQRCGITENISSKTINVVEYNKSLEIVDLRQNDMMCISTVNRILQLLREKQFGHPPEYQWGNTAVSLTWNSLHDSSSKFSFAVNNLYKTKSAPMGNLSKNSTSTFVQPVRKSKTVQNVTKMTDKEKNQLNENERKVLELNSRLEAEIQKRKEIEKRNEVLEHKLEEIQSATKTDEKSSTLKTIISAIGIKAKKSISAAGDVKKKTKQDKCKTANSKKNGYCNKNEQECIGKANGYKNGVACNGVLNIYKNGYSSKVVNDAYKILETLVNSGSKVEDDKDDQNMLSCYINDAESCRTYTCEKKDVSNDVSDSQVSLINYMEELKLANSAISSTNRNATCNSKYFIKENQKR
ncbi:protein Cep78 homolog [Anoplophora glabripennis]|uniref:protein Cep78 homolog n=1 Tax=Anoplophora glabripennis TaxID=217634 RepID=UPI000874982B|nr:protein Cep78 homolog [Anoplophora glabripennis]